jgi:DNA-binding Lrp family transcriptional regulator
MAKPGRKPKVVPGDVLDMFGAREDRAEPLIASEIADTLGCSRKTAYNKLRSLEEDGDLTSKKVGGRSRVYWVPIRENGSPPLSENKQPHEQRRDVRSEVSSDPLKGIEFPAGRDRAECEAAIYAARDYLRDHGSASMRELVVQVMPAHPVGYEVPEIADGELLADRFQGAWWRTIVKPGLKALPDVDTPVGGGKWRYTADERS